MNSEGVFMIFPYLCTEFLPLQTLSFMLHSTLRATFLLLSFLLCANAQAVHMFDGIWHNADKNISIFLKHLHDDEFACKLKTATGEGRMLCKIADKQFVLSKEGKEISRASFVVVSPFQVKIDDLVFDWKDRWNPDSPVAENGEPIPAPQPKPKTAKRATITHVVLEKISDTKPSGAAWDNYMGNYKPDAYAIIYSPGGNELWRSASRHDDLTNAACPVQWSLSNAGGVAIEKEFFNESYIFELWDMDNTTLHDKMVGFKFRVGGYKERDIIAEENGFRIVLKIRWDME